jgi:2-amino-4-hydroxy-6-hydroxymethyldihydropteridine diphosphokinase
VNTVLLALGANMRGAWGSPAETLCRARREIAAALAAPVRASRVYATEPLGPGRQAYYLNAVLAVPARLPPGALLRRLKAIERRAGRRRTGARWGPRCLDIDLLDCGGARLGWPPRRRARERLTLPHPEMHLRPFVLIPLLEVAPHWRHPALGVGAATLLARLRPGSRRGWVRQILDFADPACDKEALAQSPGRVPLPGRLAFRAAIPPSGAAGAGDRRHPSVTRF